MTFGCVGLTALLIYMNETKNNETTRQNKFVF